MGQGRLVTASCTTGWLDWIHGELWLFPDGLLRSSTGLKTTWAHGREKARRDHDRARGRAAGVVQTVTGEPRSREFADGEIERIVASRRRNLWIEADRIKRADLNVGRHDEPHKPAHDRWPKDQAVVASRRPSRAAADDSAVIVGSRDGSLTRGELDEG